MGGYFHGFYYGLPRTAKGYDSILIIVDYVTKFAHFLLVDARYMAMQYAKLYFDRIVTLHGVPLNIISDRGLVFMSHFWTLQDFGPVWCHCLSYLAPIYLISSP
jgi:hypothetical protein